MSLLPASAIMNSGQVVQTEGTALQGSARVFSNIQQASGSQYQPATAQVVNQQGSPPPMFVSSPSPAYADALKPKLDYAERSLSELKARTAELEPTSATESLQNRLDLLNVQFRQLGNHLQESAAKDDPMQLLRLQNDIYQLDEELELVSKVVEQATNGVRSLLQTQL